MKKKSAKKQVKASKPAKKVDPMDALRTQNMRLTQEFDRLATQVARQGDLLFRIHQMLQTEKLMPYEIIIPIPVQTSDTKKSGDTVPPVPVPIIGRGKEALVVNAPTGPQMGMFPNRPEIKDYFVRLKKQETTLGYLSTTMTWTFDPLNIARFESKEEAVKGLKLVAAALPEGAKPHIEERRG